MEMEITLPDKVAAMTLPGVAFFPQALLPLHIFEPRYRQMLKDSLGTHRLFAVAGIDRSLLKKPNQFEPPHRIATVGIVRACQENDDGTSNLLLQGLARVEILDIVREHPYRYIRIRALSSSPGATADENARLCQSLSRLITTKQRLGGPVPKEFTQFLKTVDDPEAFVDLAAFNLCESPVLKQKLLETLDVHARMELFSSRIRFEIDAIKIQRKLQGHLSDDQIPHN